MPEGLRALAAADLSHVEAVEVVRRAVERADREQRHAVDLRTVRQRHTLRRRFRHRGFAFGNRHATLCDIAVDDRAHDILARPEPITVEQRLQPLQELPDALDDRVLRPLRITLDAGLDQGGGGFLVDQGVETVAVLVGLAIAGLVVRLQHASLASERGQCLHLVGREQSVRHQRVHRLVSHLRGRVDGVDRDADQIGIALV